jgi:hypothetical protein
MSKMERLEPKGPRESLADASTSTFASTKVRSSRSFFNQERGRRLMTPLAFNAARYLQNAGRQCPVCHLDSINDDVLNVLYAA